MLYKRLNGGKPLPHSRDCTEVDWETGIEALKIIENHPMKTCLLDDIDYYETREKLIAQRARVYDKYF